MVNSLDPSTSSAMASSSRRHAGSCRRASPSRGRPHRQRRRPPHRRVVADGRRPAARRLPRERDHPAARRRRAGADHPQVRGRPVPGRRPDRVRHADRGTRRAARLGGAGRAERARLGRHRHRQDHAAERAVELHPRRPSASSRSRTPSSSSCTRSTWSGSRAAPNIEGRGEVTVRDLVRNSLRMRPDRIIVGEVRGAEALDMLQAMNTGHDGSISTIHCNSPRDAFSRLETMVLMSGLDLAEPGDPRADRVRHRPGRPPRPPARRHAASSPRSPR
jgi:hypothetical protein